MNDLYEHARALIKRGDLDWRPSSVKALLIDRDIYVPDLKAHQYLADVPECAVVSTSVVQGKKVERVEGGQVWHADETTFRGCASGRHVGFVVFVLDTGRRETSLLIDCIDTAMGLPFITSGGDVIATWDAGERGIARLAAHELPQPSAHECASSTAKEPTNGEHPLRLRPPALPGGPDQLDDGHHQGDPGRYRRLRAADGRAPVPG